MSYDRKRFAFSAWGVMERRTAKSLDGAREYLIGCASVTKQPELSGAMSYMFRTRAEARAYIEKTWGHIRHRSDLHELGWKMPKAVRIKVTVSAIPLHAGEEG